MADFPNKVSTETSSPHYDNQGGIRGTASTLYMDLSFIRSIPAILMMVEILLGLIHWALIASTFYRMPPAYAWVMFVAVTLWIFTTVLFLMLLFGTQRLLPSVPWPLVVMVYHGVATVLYFTAFVTNAATVHYFILGAYDHLAAASFFGAVVNVAYGASAFFSFKDWKWNGGTTSTVPT